MGSLTSDALPTQRYLEQQWRSDSLGLNLKQDGRKCSEEYEEDGNKPPRFIDSPQTHIKSLTETWTTHTAYGRNAKSNDTASYPRYTQTCRQD